MKFEEYFYNKISQLIFTFPEDAQTSTGSPFWSAPKRFPAVVKWSPDDAWHRTFVQSLAILLAEVYGLAVPEWGHDAVSVAEAGSEVVVPPFVPVKGVQIETDPQASGPALRTTTSDAEAIEELCTKLETIKSELSPDFRLNPVIFEKDDDANYHMDLITALANMRARNYRLQEVDKLKAKLIAGRIIPAIATATAMATGLVCLEIYKVH